MNRADVLCITESWLTPQIPDSAVNIPGFNLFRNDRTNAMGGGVCTYLRHDIPCKRLVECESPDVESLWLHLRPHSLPRSISSITLCVVYHSTANGNPENEALCHHIRKNLDALLIKQPNALVLVTGDFNPTSTGINLKDLTRPNSLKQLVTFNTRDSGILDWLMTNRPYLFKVTQLPKIGRSDHFSILATPTSGSIPLPVRKTQVRDLRDSAWRAFGRWLTKKNWSHILSIDTCKEKFNTFIMELQNAVDTYLPWKSVRVHPTDRPWTTRKIKILIKKRQEAFTRDGKDSATYKRLRNKVQREIKSAKYYYFHHKVSDLETTDQKKWWRQIKSLSGQDIKSKWHHQFLGDSCPDTYSLANKVNSYFVSLTSDFEPLQTTTPLRQEVPPHFLVNTTEVRNALSGIKIGKAIGPDMLPNRVLKEFADELALPIMDIYNCSLSEGYVPDLLKSSIVNPIPKVSPPQEIDSDLRPISLTCTIAKIMEGFCRSRLVVQIGNNLDPRQYAREGLSTVDALIYLLHAIHEATDTELRRANILRGFFQRI